MLKIRLKRRGKKKSAHYRIVVAEAHRARNGKHIEDLGFYNPNTKPSTFEIDQKKAKEWLAKGAQPTDTVAQYLVKEGILDTWRKRKASKLPQPKNKKKEDDSSADETTKEEN